MATPAEAAAKKLASEFEARKSIELRTFSEITNHLDDRIPKGSDTFEEHYIETAAGQRFKDILVMASGKVTSHSQHFGDGSKFADVQFSATAPDRQTNMVIKRQFAIEGRSDRKEIPVPLLFFYVGRTPLHEALPKSRHLGTDKVMGRECDKFLFPEVRWAVVQDQIFYLDRETAIPLKFEIFAPQKTGEYKEPTSEWTAESLDKVQGRHIPFKSIMTSKNPDGRLAFTWNYTVKSIAFDKEYPASTFWPTPRPGVSMFDTTTGKAKTIPGDAKEKTDTQATIPARDQAESEALYKAAAETASTRAVPPTAWTATASNVSLALGCAVLLAGLFLWWRRG